MRRMSGCLATVIKVLAVIAVIALGLIIYQTCAGSPLVQRIDKTEPAPSVAPFRISTMTRTYLAQSAELNPDGSVTMLRWYERDQRKWRLRPDPVTLPPLLRPRIERR